MENDPNCKGLCSICREAMTTVHAELEQGKAVYVCRKCLETARENFIWICMHCGSVFIRPKVLVLNRLTDMRLRRAYAECAGEMIIQGIDLCVECDPQGIAEVVAAVRSRKSGGYC